MRELVYNKFKGKCAYCGCTLHTIKEMQVDHIFPQFLFTYYAENPDKTKKEGYPDCDVNHIDNLNPACRSCNIFKSSWTLEEFRKELELQYDRHIKNSAKFRLMERYGIVKKQKEKILFYYEKEK